MLSTAFFYARYSKCMEEETGFGMRNSLTLPSLTNSYFNSLRDENDEPIYNYNDDYMRWLVRQSIKRGRSSVLNGYYKSNIYVEVFYIISKEVDIIGNICEVLEKCFEYENKHR